MNPLAAFRRVLVAYLAGLAVLGAVTLAWALTEAVILDNATLATAWFAVAGAGTMLTVALILRAYRSRARERALESLPLHARTND
jgi:preprotein translocase subunit SecY